MYIKQWVECGGVLYPEYGYEREYEETEETDEETEETNRKTNETNEQSIGYVGDEI